MKLPTLYKRTNTGALQYWDIQVAEYDGHGIITTTYGQLGTDSPQMTDDVISEGKNIGKKNETTAYQQAEKEAWAKWEKQLKKGYTKTIEEAQAGQVDEIVEGGVNVMLAKSYAKDGHKIKYPAYISPKLDGLRCVAVVKNGVCTLWSRTRKPITSMPHIVESLTGLADVTLDGEIYSDTHSDNFEEIVSLVRQENPDANHAKVQYHIFDVVNDSPYYARLKTLQEVVKKVNSPHVKAVESLLVEDEEQALDYFQIFTAKKFEGAMIRNADSFYVGKRSADLQKIKEFEDREFEIVDIEEGRGKLSGHVGAFVCVTDEGLTFKAKMSGNTDRLKDYFQDRKLWEGKLLTVQYQSFTQYGAPRFPVGLRIRETE